MRRCSWMIMAVCALASSGCFEDLDLPYNTGSLGGYVMISGPVRGARVTIDQLNAHTGTVYQHIGDDTTDERGHFLIPETRLANGLFLMVARGGTFEDLATRATIQLDDTDELRSLLQFPLLADRDDGLVSPIGHLIEAWAWAKLPELGDMTCAVDDATAHLAKHFGQATQWGLQKLHDLGTPATSPTEPVRTAFVHAALSYLAHDIASAAGASAQQINVYTLLQRWTADLVRDGLVDPAGFDGNDGNDATFGSGLQLGYCEPLAPPCADPPAGCRTGYCRVPCDLYSNTPRALLAGAITRVIQDGTVNRTGLGIADLLQIARAVSDNADRSLFGDSCIEPLDRTRPDVRWDDSATPATDAAVAGVIGLKAIGTDDVDLQPRTEIIGYADQDGDPSNSVAIASIDTATVLDGDLIVSARAVDLAGNSSTITRRLIVDNTSPQLTMSSAGFFVDGSTWWTASAAPVLTGTVSDATSVAVKAVIEGGSEVAGVVDGAIWTIAIPPGVLDASGTAVQIVAIDAAGNRSNLALRLRPDVEPPALSFQASTVNDEEDDWVTFAADHSPRHLHAGTPVDLATAAGCPSLTKHSYLLGPTSPEYTAELPGPNPLRYQLVTDDPGVGIAAGSTEYRVGRRAGLQTIWVQDWTSAGTGIPIGTGVTRFPIGIFSDVVAGLATTEGIYDVELRATDRLARTTTAARCFELHLRAPPLELEFPTTSRPTKDHAYALDSLSLAPGAQYDQIAARLLNNNATGASLIDQDVFNGTTETIYLTVTVTKPYSVMVSQTFRVGNAHTNVTAANCGNSCNTPLQVTEFTSNPSGPQATTLHFPAKVFELVNGQPATEIPCLAPCVPSGTVFKFAIPPRAGGGQPARAFRVMTMIGQISELWPRDGDRHKEVQPFDDTAITWADDNGFETTTRLTGKVYYSSDPAYTGCVMFVTDPSNPNNPPVCMQEGTIVPYLALRSAELTFTTDTGTRYETAATATLAPALAGSDKFRRAVPANIWTTAEGTLP